MVESRLSTNRFGQVQIIKISLEKFNLNLTKIIWTQPKPFGPDQNNLYQSKKIWTVQNYFGPIECVLGNKRRYAPTVNNHLKKKSNSPTCVLLEKEDF